MDTTPVLIADVRVPLRDFDLRVRAEVGPETLALVGPSGAGKSTFLAAVAGLVRPEEGRVALGDRVWFDAAGRVDVPPETRAVGMVFQDYALFPHLTVAANVAFGGRSRARELMERVGIAHLAAARPGEISGGERQRVALARALARGPAVLLLDEPLSALDPHTRSAVRAELGGLLRDLALPTVLVTHDIEDAAALGARIAVLREGRIVQEGAHRELLARPRDAFVASLVGANLLAGVARPGPAGLTEVVLAEGGTVLSGEAGSGAVGVVVDPWEVTLAREAPDDSQLNRVSGTVRSVVRLGNRVRVQVGPVTADVTELSAERLGLREGDPVVAVFKALGTRLVTLDQDRSTTRPPGQGGPPGNR